MTNGTCNKKRKVVTPPELACDVIEWQNMFPKFSIPGFFILQNFQIRINLPKLAVVKRGQIHAFKNPTIKGINDKEKNLMIFSRHITRRPHCPMEQCHWFCNYCTIRYLFKKRYVYGSLNKHMRTKISWEFAPIRVKYSCWRFFTSRGRIIQDTVISTIFLVH